MIMLHMQPITRARSSSTTAWPRARRLAQRSTFVACTVAALAAPGVASGADTVIVDDPDANEVAALDGTVVWVSGNDDEETRNTNQTLMQHSGGVTKRVKDAPRANYRSIDLGHDRKGKLVLTYRRCGQTKCVPIQDNLKGRRSSFKKLTLKRCELTTAPAMWGARIAYGLLCRKPNNVTDPKRTRVYVKTGAGTPRRLRSPTNDFARRITSVDLRRNRVAAVADGVADFAFRQKVDATELRSLQVGLAQGDSGSFAKGVSLGTGSAMWALSSTEPVGKPVGATIFKVLGDCYRSEVLPTPFSDPDKQRIVPALDIAVDGTTVYLAVSGVGIVKHEFVPQGDCTKL